MFMSHGHITVSPFLVRCHNYIDVFFALLTLRETSYNCADSLSGEAKSCYLSKLAKINLTECPYNLPADVWSEDPSTWPDLQWPEVYNYLVNTPGMK